MIPVNACRKTQQMSRSDLNFYLFHNWSTGFRGGNVDFGLKSHNMYQIKLNAHVLKFFA